MANKEVSDGDVSLNIDAQLNPFLLHHSFALTSVLVNQPLTGAYNYVSWSRAMMMALSGKNKDGFIDGTIEKPTNAKLAKAWKFNNDIIASWIINSVSKEITTSIVYSGSVKNVWDELADRFKESTLSIEVYQLQKELITTTQGTLSIEVYFTRLKKNLAKFE